MRTDETVAHCRRLAERLWLAFLTDSGSTRSVESFALWLIARKRCWSVSTWRLYRWAVVAALRDGSVPAAPGDMTIGAAISRLAREPSAGARNDSDRTSATVAKWLPPLDRDAILRAVTCSRSKYAAFLADIMIATLAAGLRPTEWRGAALRSPEPGFGAKLVVLNHKATNGRAGGAFRTLRWRRFPDAIAEPIQRMVEAASSVENRDGFAALLKATQELLRATDRALFPDARDRYALYSARHQFAANIKRRYGPAECAALMGHASDATIFRNYGRIGDEAGGGGPGGAVPGPDLPEADPDEVAQVRVRWAVLLKRLETLTSEPMRLEVRDSSNLCNVSELEIPDFPVPTPQQVSHALRLQEIQREAGAALLSAYVAKLERDLDALRLGPAFADGDSPRPTKTP